MRNHFVLIFFLFISQIVFCQTENINSTLKELQKANGKLKIESYYPVDTNTYFRTNVFLDSNLKVTNRHFTKGKYIITQNVTYDWWRIARICKRKPHRVKLDSTEIIQKTEYSLAIQYTRILKGQLNYKRFFKAYDYKIENGFVTQVKQTNRKGTKIKILFDFSGLYLEKNKTWPIHTVYRKNGSVKRIVRELYINKTTHIILWKPD